MKKYFSLLLVVALAFTMAISTFAAPNLPNEGQDVTAEYTAPVSEDGGKVYSVTLTWTPTDNTLKYTGKNATYNWDVDKLQYVETVNNENEIGWTGSVTYEITVTNKSNADIEAATTATNPKNLTLTEPQAKTQTVPSAAVNGTDKIEYTDTNSVGTVQTATFTYKYEAKTDADAITAATDVVVGRITVTITAA